jgi:(p)ppGpp synthase/HD superfamily hydrolase
LGIDLSKIDWIKLRDNLKKTTISLEIKPGMFIGGVRVADIDEVRIEMGLKPKKTLTPEMLGLKVMTLESAIALAANAHRGQKDLAGEPYILHPLRVMSKFKLLNERMTAVLHDVVEDTKWTLEELQRANVPFQVLNAVGFLTRHKGMETYMEYIGRICAQNPLALAIKIADLRDNLDLTRLHIDDIGKYKSLIKREVRALDYCLSAWPDRNARKF